MGTYTLDKRWIKFNMYMKQQIISKHTQLSQIISLYFLAVVSPDINFHKGAFHGRCSAAWIAVFFYPFPDTPLNGKHCSWTM